MTHALVFVSRQASSSANSPFRPALEKFGSAQLGSACPLPGRGTRWCVRLSEISLSLLVKVCKRRLSALECVCEGEDAQDDG